MAEGDRRKRASRGKGAPESPATPIVPLRAPHYAGSTRPQDRSSRPLEQPAAQPAAPTAQPKPGAAQPKPGAAQPASASTQPGPAKARRAPSPGLSNPLNSAGWVMLRAQWTTVRTRLRPPTGPDAPIAVLAALVAVAFIWYSFINQGHRASLDYYVPLADAFLHGRLYVIAHPSYLNELVPYGGHYYVVYPPAPAVLLMPLVAVFGNTFDQARASIALGAVDVALAAAVAYRVVGPRRWIWVLFAIMFGFGSTVWYEVMSGNSWHFAHVCATTFLLLAIIDVQHDGPPWRIGLLLGCAVLSRLPTALAVFFFLGYFAWRADGQNRVGRAAETFAALGGRAGTILSSKLDWRQFILDSLSFGFALAIPILVYFMYNEARFGSPLQQGYSLIPGLMQEYQYRHGFLAIESIGRNLYAMLLNVPKQIESFPFVQPRNLGGLSIFLTTPAFLWAFRAHRPSWFMVGAWLSILGIIVPLLLHADPGGAEFGYRYAIDFYPFIFLLMIHGMRGRMNAERWAAMALCFLVNIWGMYAVMTGWLA